MEKKNYEIEPMKPFSESLIWQLNRDYYDDVGMDAWREGAVPHHLTSNSIVGKTYAELVFALLKDLALKGQKTETVYVLELGAGHGRLAYHILKHLERLIESSGLDLPPFCYVLSDIVEDNLAFFDTHPQLQSYFATGLLDISYFDAIGGKELVLRRAKKTILPQELKQPIVALANYFFDSIPTDLFYFNNNKVEECWVALETKEDPAEMDSETLLKKMELAYYKRDLKMPFYEEEASNTVLAAYKDLVFSTYLLFPHKSFQCIANINALSQKGLFLITMDKGYQELRDLENEKQPEWITHGSFSIPVNFHALAMYCENAKGKVFLPEYSTFHLQLACFSFLPDSESYKETKAAYLRFVDEFGPDDFYGLNKFTYKHIADMSLRELIGMMRLSAYDSTFFQNILPRIKQVYQEISLNERFRLSQTMHRTWNMYYTFNENHDLAFEMGGIFYDLGYHQDALDYFDKSVALYGHTADSYYNRVLCCYQLRKDVLFKQILDEALVAFPNYAQMEHLSTLDLKE